MMKMVFFLFSLLLIGCSDTVNRSSDTEGPLRDTVYLPAVGPPVAIAMTADKMNVVYLGIDNLMSIKSDGIDPWKIKVAASRGEIRGSGKQYVYRPSGKVGSVKFTVSGPEGVLDEFEFRVMRIPDVVAEFGGKTEGEITWPEIKAQKGIYVPIRGLNIKGTCEVLGFELLWVSKEKRISAVNIGGSFRPMAQNLIHRSMPGDIYLFTDIKARCPGDEVARRLPSMVFMIK